jgi:hypothetical protein
MRKILIPLIFAFGCTSMNAPLTPPDPCSLLTKEEVFAVQGDAFVDAGKTLHTSGDITVAQCFYRLPDAARSVTLEVTTARNVHELWEKQFEPGGERERERERGESERESGETHAIEIKGLGRDASWSGNRVSGALYILTRHAILRISIGGSGDQASKIERATKLAKAALPRL